MARKPEPFSLPSSSDFLINARYRVETAAIISRIFKHETEKLWVSVFSEPIVDSLYQVLSRETSLTRNSTKVVRDGCEKMEIGFPFLLSFLSCFLKKDFWFARTSLLWVRWIYCLQIGYIDAYMPSILQALFGIPGNHPCWSALIPWSADKSLKDQNQNYPNNLTISQKLFFSQKTSSLGIAIKLQF